MASSPGKNQCFVRIVTGDGLAQKHKHLTRNMEALEVRAHSLHPLATAGEALLAGEVEDQAEQRRLAPLERRRVRVVVRAGDSAPQGPQELLTIFSLASTNTCFPAESTTWSSFRGKASCYPEEDGEGKGAWRAAAHSPRCRCSLGCSRTSSAAPHLSSGQQTPPR